MNDYISRETLIKEVDKYYEQCEYSGEWEDVIGLFMDDLYKIFDNIPAVAVDKEMK